MAKRDPNLDLLRALAIVLVVLFHTFNPRVPAGGLLDRLVQLGPLGVDLFFVLSGFLIGRLYWREQARFGNVDIPRFLGRRWLRTLPPYFGGLVLAYAAVYASRREPFDWRYLVFLQNYAFPFPNYFSVSWSLCVEEHFYIALPLLLCLTRRLPRLEKPLAIATCTAPLLLRLASVWTADPLAHGYYQTATHLNADGMALGVVLSAICVRSPAAWARLQALARRYAAAAVAIGTLLWMLNGTPRYLLEPLLAAIAWGWLLTALADQLPSRLARSKSVYAIAATSYSVYLTHALALHAAHQVASRAGITGDAVVCLLIIPALIAAAGAAFFFTVERPTIRVRDRLIGRRAV